MVLTGSYLNMALGLVYTIVLTRLLTPSDFGVFALAAFFYSLLNLRDKLGLDYAFVRMKGTTSDLVGTHLALQLFLSAMTLILAAAAYGVLPILGYGRQTAVLLGLLGLVGLIDGLASTARQGLEKELVFGWTTLVVSSALATSYVAAIALAARGFGAAALVAQVAVNAVLSLIGFWWVFLRRRPGLRLLVFSPFVARALVAFGLVMGIGSLATVMAYQFDNFLVGTLLGLTALGFYERAYRVAQWPTGLVTHVISRAAFPTYAKLQDDPVRLRKAFELTVWVIAAAALPLALALFVTAPDFILVLFGPDWAASAVLLRFLVFYSALRPLLDDTGPLLMAVGRLRNVVQVLALQAGVLIVAGPLLTARWDARGTALAVGFSLVAAVALAYRFVAKALGEGVGRILMGPALALVGGAAVSALWLSLVDRSAWSPLLRVVADGGLTLLGYASVLWLIEGDRLKERLRYVASVAGGRRGSPEP